MKGDFLFWVTMVSFGGLVFYRFFPATPPFLPEMLCVLKRAAGVAAIRVCPLTGLPGWPLWGLLALIRSAPLISPCFARQSGTLWTHVRHPQATGNQQGSLGLTGWPCPLVSA